MSGVLQKLKKSYWRAVKLPLYKQKVLKYYKNNPDSEKYRKHLEYLKHHKVDSLLGNYVDKYKYINIEIYTDLLTGLPYVFHNDKKLFFKRDMAASRIKKVYTTLLTEQDPDSAHCYFNNMFKLKPGEVFYDIGAAEGIIALDVIENAGKVVLFEASKPWIEALEATFAPWKEKVTIVPKYVADTDAENFISIDTFISQGNPGPDLIKMDVEGYEEKVLSGMKKYLQTANHLKIAVCTYHYFNDTEKFERFFKEIDYKVSFSDGFMLYYNNTKTIRPPYFIRGVLRAEKFD